ncbi:MAG: hypothetical protein SFV15_18695, partial [Polyangiaceae bacterium]|nr:hypothetical protein [Polyangiaceae bacterium]
MPYKEITPSIGVVWQVGAPHPEYGFHEVFRLRGDKSGEIYSEALSLHVLQLGLAPRRKPVGEPESDFERKVRLCARFLSVKSRQELEELEQEEPSMTDAANTLKNLSSDPEIARLAHERAEAEYFY